MNSLRAIVGLGNPGEKYGSTRHNAGFWFLDTLASDSAGKFRAEAKFFGDLCQVTVGGHRLWLLKPMTYMNCSGQAVSSLCKYHKIEPAELLVIHDEIDLPAGTVKLKVGGGHGGHNGLRDIVKALGSNAFHRLRIGVGHPGDRDAVINYVLRAPSAEEAAAIHASIDGAQDVLPMVVAGDMQRAMNRLHSAERSAD